jgi:hypothetical protein
MRAGSIGSFIFYFVTVHIPKQRYRNSSEPFIAHTCGRLVATWRGLVFYIGREAGIAKGDIVMMPSEGALKEWFTAIAIKSRRGLEQEAYEKKWRDELSWRRTEFERLISVLLTHYELPPKLHSIIVPLHASRLIDDIPLMVSPPLVTSNLEFYSDCFAEYAAVNKKLMEYFGIPK